MKLDLRRPTPKACECGRGDRCWDCSGDDSHFDDYDDADCDGFEDCSEDEEEDEEGSCYGDDFGGYYDDWDYDDWDYYDPAAYWARVNPAEPGEPGDTNCSRCHGDGCDDCVRCPDCERTYSQCECDGEPMDDPWSELREAFASHDAPKPWEVLKEQLERLGFPQSRPQRKAGAKA